MTNPPIMVVEDDPEFRALVVRILNSWGHAVIEAGGVAEALQLAAQRRPPTIVTDVGLPDGDGFSLTERVLELDYPVRVIVISSDDRPGNADAALRSGAVGFLPKDQLVSDAMHQLLNP